MNSLHEKQVMVGESIYEEIILKKHSINTTTNELCKELNLDEDEISNYILGLSKTNLALGIKILDYLENKEELILKNENVENFDWGELWERKKI